MNPSSDKVDAPPDAPKHGVGRLEMNHQPAVLGDVRRIRNGSACTVMSDRNPYQPGSTTEHPLAAETPAWKRILGSLLRIFGGLVIAIPLVAFAFDLPDADINYYWHDLPAIMTALLCYVGFGALLIFLGNKLSPKQRRMDARHDRER
ncbi:hypothetical protein [Aporhodopirellula aestuarii]|uniref:Uncharacterized protein n=1 Tax=Aporhodopirellula aestuarii TaxID=2950107 RepID=A0ABT0UG51_9BACT|nr:hypothetical protein [Aporhodopirellula aestuarii]MCM2375220.1 hypothetical protein [Aporhodopirellula aestuarii]